jgi:murein DD-endopeptidase MepM/ murein hydrolase activator NlpD
MPDSDGDGISDYDEYEKYKSKPLSIESDNDSISDYDEVNLFYTNPSIYDHFLLPLLPTDNFWLSSTFGKRTHPITKVPGTDHDGIDLACIQGTEIYASTDGEVIQASDTGNGYGKCVKIRYAGEIITLYAHCYSINVELGEKVKRGQLIATVGSTGNSTGNHLHFEIKINNLLCDPMDYINVFPNIEV